MLTLEQFRATGKEVADIGLYDGGDAVRPGMVYMDGRLSIEKTRDGRWLLCIGNMEKAAVDLPSLEAMLYAWAFDEYGDMFSCNEYRIPPCPINPTEQDARDWLRAMNARGLAFHLDDDPAEVVNARGATFNGAEVDSLRGIQRDLFRTIGDRVHDIALEIDSAK